MSHERIWGLLSLRYTNFLIIIIIIRVAVRAGKGHGGGLYLDKWKSISSNPSQLVQGFEWGGFNELWSWPQFSPNPTRWIGWHFDTTVTFPSTSVTILWSLPYDYVDFSSATCRITLGDTPILQWPVICDISKVIPWYLDILQVLLTVC